MNLQSNRSTDRSYRDGHLRVEGECFGVIGVDHGRIRLKDDALTGRLESGATHGHQQVHHLKMNITRHYSTNTKPQHTGRVNGAGDAPRRRWPPPRPLRTSLPACRRKTHTALSCKPRAGGKKPTNQSKEPSFSREQQLTLTFSMDPFWKTCCSSHTTQYSFRVGIRCSEYFII